MKIEIQSDILIPPTPFFGLVFCLKGGKMSEKNGETAKLDLKKQNEETRKPKSNYLKYLNRLELGLLIAGFILMGLSGAITAVFTGAIIGMFYKKKFENSDEKVNYLILVAPFIISILITALFYFFSILK